MDEEVPNNTMKEMVSAGGIEARIFVIRGLKVMIDRDLAELYGVPTKVLKQAVKRNGERFPTGFTFRLSRREVRELVTNCDQFRTLKHASAAPLAFTEYGVAMLSSVLRSGRAIRINIRIIQAFIRLRRLSGARKEIAAKVEELEKKVRGHDRRFDEVFDALRGLLGSGEEPRRVIGFRPEASEGTRGARKSGLRGGVAQAS